MPRRLKNWITSYMEYTDGTEAPKIMHFWAGVSAMAGALRRKVWIDMTRFIWTPNFYIVFVAPPGVVSKTTTMDLGMKLLRQVPGIKFGPDIVTWPALVKIFSESGELFPYGEDFIPMAALTLASGELGNLINMQDRDAINLYIALWDGLKTLDKQTKGSGSEGLSAPWINLLGCTTPQWIGDNMVSATVGGGFTSRCIFVYADKKERFIAYPDEAAKKGVATLVTDLIEDLTYISTSLTGPFSLPEETRQWGREWYERLWTKGRAELKDDRLEGYLARKQTHVHKLAMVMSVSRSDELVISPEDLQLADMMVSATEADLDKVFAKIGRTEDSLQAERLIEFIRRKSPVPYQAAYHYIYDKFPDFRDFEGVITGLIRSGQVVFDVSRNPDPTKGLLVYVPGGLS